MLNLMITTFFGMIFVFSMTLLTIGVMFVLRTLTIIWFDVDFMERIRRWFVG